MDKQMLEKMKQEQVKQYDEMTTEQVNAEYKAILKRNTVLLFNVTIGVLVLMLVHVIQTLRGVFALLGSKPDAAAVAGMMFDIILLALVIFCAVIIILKFIKSIKDMRFVNLIEKSKHCK